MAAKTITALTAQKKNPHRVNLYLDNDFAFSLSRISAAWLAVGQTLTDSQIVDLLDSDVKERAYQRALNFLSYRPRSEAEIAANLMKHETPQEVTEETLSRLRRAGLVDDQKFARDWVSNRIEFNPRGIRGLRHELRQKQISEETVEEVLQGIDEEDLAYFLASKKADQYRDLDRERFFSKMSGLLVRRGFRSDTVYSVTRRVWQEHNESTLDS